VQTRFYTPHPLLQEFINCIMIVHAQVDKGASPVICSYVPTPQNSLFFYINDQIKMKKVSQANFALQSRSVIVGPQVSKVTLDLNRNHKAVRVGFHPGGLYRLLGIPMSEMMDDNCDAVDIFGKEMEELNDQLQEAKSFDAIHAIIEKFLLQKVRVLKKALPFDQAMLELLKADGNLSVDEIASLACLSVRQFERVSKDRIGMPPKMFARLVRFSKAYRMRENSAQLSWTSIAHVCGYFDQMHFIRDFKEFAGVSPGILERELQHLPVRLQAGLRL
jgi:AraC-like DNA-binding protein